MIRIGRGFLWTTILALSSVALADEPAVDPSQIPTIKLTLHPAAPVRPALRYRLLPDRLSRTPGNGATFYYRALLLYHQNQGRQAHETTFGENQETWTSAPCEGEVRQAMKKWVAEFPRGSQEQLREAAYREYCNFDYRIADRSGLEVISFLLPEIQEMRNLGHYLAIKSRIEIAEGRYDDALESLRLGYQVSKDTASEPLLINGLVGIFVAGLMNGEMEHWISSPDSPNLYWAVATIPQPLVDLRPALDQESRLAETLFPFLKDVETTQRTPEEWQRQLSEAVQQIMTNLEQPLRKSQNPLEKLQSDFAVTALIMRAYPMAKDDLKKAGYDEVKLDKLPVAQVVAMHMQRTVRYLGDEFAKGAYLPTSQREEYYANLDQRLIKEGYFGHVSREAIPLASLLMPAVANAMGAQSRLERDLAALQTLEAIRAHLAETGSLPEKLSDIKVLPVPPNPVTNEPFEYRLADGTAVLEVPPVRKGRPTGKRYELTAAKK